MKTTTALALGLLVPLGALAAQESKPAAKCEAGKKCDAARKCSAAKPCRTACTSAATSSAASQCPAAANEIGLAFGKLPKDRQQAVRAAFADVVKTCPIGSKIPGTVAALDRLYTEAATSLGELAKQNELPEGLRADAKKAFETVARLQKLNRQNLAAIRLVAGKALAATPAPKGEDCGECDDCDTCSSCDDTKLTPVSRAADLTKKWGTAMAEFDKVSQCKATMASMKECFDVLAANKVDVPGFVTANLRSQLAILDESCAGIACPKSGLAAKHEKICESCSWTKDHVTTAAQDVVAAHRLIKVVPFLKAKK